MKEGWKRRARDGAVEVNTGDKGEKKCLSGFFSTQERVSPRDASVSVSYHFFLPAHLINHLVLSHSPTLISQHICSHKLR